MFQLLINHFKRLTSSNSNWVNFEGLKKEIVFDAVKCYFLLTSNVSIFNWLCVFLFFFFFFHCGRVMVRETWQLPSGDVNSTLKAKFIFKIKVPLWLIQLYHIYGGTKCKRTSRILCNQCAPLFSFTPCFVPKEKRDCPHDTTRKNKPDW